MQEMQIWSLGQEDPLEYAVAYSCLENPMDRGAWWGTVQGVAESQTQLKWLSILAHVKLKLQFWAGPGTWYELGKRLLSGQIKFKISW